MAICPKSGRNALLAEFKFGGLLRYVIAWIWYAILTNIDMAVSSATAKSPNLNHRYNIIYNIYGMHCACIYVYNLYISLCLLIHVCMFARYMSVCLYVYVRTYTV